MSILTMAEALALNVGLPVPINLAGGLSRDWREILQTANEAGEDIARRVQWGELTKTTTLAGSGPLPSDFDRLVAGLAIMAEGRPVRSLTRAEWASLPTQAGTPRYFLLQDDNLQLWPDGPVTVVYQSRNWVGGNKDRLKAADDAPVFEETLLLKAVIARWRRQKGLPHADEEAEFEAALAQYAAADDRSRV